MVPNVLAQRLRQRRILEPLVQWIEDFTRNRQASLTVNSVIEHTGLTQGSPLSPILFLFFNADLVSSVINKNKGAIAFIDDFTSWVTGISVKDNLDKLRNLVIRKVERWASTSGAVFNAGKTVLTHFTRTKRFDQEVLSGNQQLCMGNKVIKAQAQAKLLGVVFDSRLSYTLHIAQVCKRGFSA